MTKDKLLDMALEALQFKNILNACGQYSVVDPVKASEAIIAIKRDRALEKKAENARELGLDYEPEERYTYGTPLLDAFTKPAPVQESVAFNAGVPPLYPEMKDGETISVEYTTPPAAQRQWVGTVDCVGLALDLEVQAKRAESQTVERAMLAAANGLRIIDKESKT